MQRVSEYISLYLLRTGVSLRVRHMRGHGVHSPFAYRFIRDIYMNRSKWRDCEGMPVFECMVKRGMRYCDAAIVQFLYDYVKAKDFVFYGEKCLTPDLTPDNIMYVYSNMSFPESNYAFTNGVTVVMSPRKSLKRYEMCRTLINAHKGLSMDCRSSIMFFHYKGLSKEHIKL